LEPISHFFYSDRLKLQLWDFGSEGKPPIILVHGGLDHARSWDWVAKTLREDFHVYAMDLRGHGNSAWAPGAMYSVAEHVLDLSVLVEIISRDHDAALCGRVPGARREGGGDRRRRTADPGSPLFGAGTHPAVDREGARDREPDAA
jgi:alpha-beta hydrolase superfamily lysophospholipase